MTTSSSRRHFLRMVTSGSAALGVACLGAGCVAAGPTGPIPAGNVSDLATPSLQGVSGESVAIGRDAGGIYALSLICTHAACDMESQGEVSPSGITCFCHGSRFSANGAVLQGPASSPLEHYEVTADASGALTINADKTVPASTRLRV